MYPGRGEPNQLFTISLGQLDRALLRRRHDAVLSGRRGRICQQPTSQPETPELSSDTLLADDAHLVWGLVEATSTLAGDGDDILDADAEPVREVDARFDREAHAGLDEV